MPIASTTWTAGQPATIQWGDDGTQPSLAQLGVCDITISVGSAQQQVSTGFASEMVVVPAQGRPDTTTRMSTD